MRSAQRQDDRTTGQAEEPTAEPLELLELASRRADTGELDLRGEADQRVGVVVQMEGPTAIVRAGGAEVRARRAASCLLEPMNGDLVLLARLAGGGAYVLAVLERDESSVARLSLEGDVELRFDAGRLAVVARDGVDLVTKATVRLVGRALEARAVKATLGVEHLSAVGKVAQASFEEVHTLATRIESVAERYAERFKRAYRRVAEVDHLRAGTIDHAAEATAKIHGKHTLINGEDLVKVDAEQVHIG